MLSYQQCLFPFCEAIQRTEHPIFELAGSKLFGDRLLTRRANILFQTLAQIIFFSFRHWKCPIKIAQTNYTVSAFVMYERGFLNEYQSLRSAAFRTAIFVGLTHSAKDILVRCKLQAIAMTRHVERHARPTRLRPQDGRYVERRGLRFDPATMAPWQCPPKKRPRSPTEVKSISFILGLDDKRECTLTALPRPQLLSVLQSDERAEYQRITNRHFQC